MRLPYIYLDLVGLKYLMFDRRGGRGRMWRLLNLLKLYTVLHLSHKRRKVNCFASLVLRRQFDWCPQCCCSCCAWSARQEQVRISGRRRSMRTKIVPAERRCLSWTGQDAVYLLMLVWSNEYLLFWCLTSVLEPADISQWDDCKRQLATKLKTKCYPGTVGQEGTNNNF